MKRCPQCNSVFEDEKIFCTEDGKPLVAETFSMPSDNSPEDHDDEQETILRYKPVDIAFSDSAPPQDQPHPETNQTPPQVNPYAPNHANFSDKASPKESRGCLTYGFILLIGLFLGGTVVLGVFGLGYYYMNSISNQNEDSKIAEKTEKTPKTETKKTSKKTPPAKHTEKNTDIDASKLNGQIIKSRSVLRSLPNSKSKRIDSLPRNDRIQILRRKNSTSKWYEVECEHGSKGWIDGYSIKFTE